MTVLDLDRNWIATVPWQRVVTANQELCQKDEQPHAPTPKGFEAAQRLWDEASRRTMKLEDALNLCRQVHKLAPFLFFNGNTVAVIGKELVDELVKPLPPVQAQIARSTVSHFVVGAIKQKELEDVFEHIGDLLKK